MADDHSDEAKRPLDVVYVHSATEDGQGARVLRLRDESLSVGEVRPVVEGQPINGREVVQLRARADAPRLFDVETLHEPPAQSATPARSGPPKVATRQFREGWDAIFGARDGDDGGTLN